jgi:hypothetical protein
MNIFKSTALQFKHCVAYLKVVPSMIPTLKNIEFYIKCASTSRINSWIINDTTNKV